MLRFLLFLGISAKEGDAEIFSIPTPLDGAEKLEYKKSLTKFYPRLEGTWREYRTRVLHQNASSIKIHFKRVNIPNGVILTVSNPDGTETYSYSNQDKEFATVDEEDGDDGESSFSAMSIEGDEAVVKLRISADVWLTDWDRLQHVVEIDSYWSGFSEEHMSTQINNPRFSSSKCGESQRHPVECSKNKYPVEYERARPVARLVMGGGLCTAWRVGPNNHMMTNNHCFSTSAKLRRSEIQFNYKYTSCNSRSKTIPVKVSGGQLLTTGTLLDFTLFTVKNFERIQRFGYFGLDISQPAIGSRIFIPQHGGGDPKQLSVESDRNFSNRCQVDKHYTRNFGYYCDTMGGSSGSPVLLASTNNVFALHNLGGCPNSGVRMHKIWPVVSRWFGGVLPQGDNVAQPPTPVSPRPPPRTTNPPIRTTQRPGPPTRTAQPPPRSGLALNLLAGPCTLKTVNGEECVQSANFPSEYGAIEKCVVEVQKSGFITARHFDTEETWDEFVLRGRYYSGKKGPKNVRVTPEVKMFWRTDFSKNYTGWSVCYTASRGRLLKRKHKATSQDDIFV